MPSPPWPRGRGDARPPAGVAVQAARRADLGDGGDVVHNTQTPLRLWFWAAYLVATHHPGISAARLQRQLGIARRERAWMLLHKLRRAMVAPERELLKREVEVDESTSEGSKRAVLAGLHTVRRSSAVSRSRSEAAVPDGCARRYSMTHPRGRCTRSCRARPRPGRSSAPTAGRVRRAVEARLPPRPDESGSERGRRSAVPPRARRAISNLKAWLHGTHRRASREHLHAYSTSSRSLTTGAATRTPPSRRSSGSALPTSPAATGTSSTKPPRRQRKRSGTHWRRYPASAWGAAPLARRRAWAAR